MSANLDYQKLEKKLIELEKKVQDLNHAEREKVLRPRTYDSSWELARLIDADYKTLCNRVITEIVDMTDSRLAFYGFLDKSESVMTLYSWSEGVLKQCSVSEKPLHFPVAQAGLWAKSIRERKAVILNDYSKRLPGKKGLPDGHVPITRVLSVPIFSNKRIVAVAVVANKPSAYVDEDIRRIKEFATAVQILLERREAEVAKRKLESQLMQLQKMEALGTMAGGIAHDFNNILSGIILNAEMAFDDADGMSEVRESIGQVLMAGQRAKELVSRILTFSRKVEFEKKPLKLSVLVKETLEMLRAMLPATVIIEQDVSDKTCTIMADSTQVQQLIINLCTNAAHAMRENGGVLKVSLNEVAIETPPADQDIVPGKYVKLTIEDNGHGISPEDKERIFDPFYTTKQPGDGTGLGLSIVLGIVKDHEGVIAIESDKEVGTTCEVLFPKKTSSSIPAAPNHRPIPTGTERILFVDDEESVADASKKIIERLGYSVVVATGGAEALEVMRQNSEQIDLIITDRTMPHMTGEQLSKKLSNLWPDVPIIVCTGSGNAGMMADDHAASIQGYILKPFNKRTIAENIRKVLDRR